MSVLNLLLIDLQVCIHEAKKSTKRTDTLLPYVTTDVLDSLVQQYGSQTAYYHLDPTPLSSRDEQLRYRCLDQQCFLKMVIVNADQLDAHTKFHGKEYIEVDIRG